MRRQPTQERARSTVGQLLDAAAALLTEVGLEGLTTNAVAARAGVNVATLYAYFDDKFSLVEELSERFERQRLEFLARQVDDLAVANDLDAWVADTIGGLAAFRAEVPASSDLRAAVASVPALRARDHANDLAAAEQLAGALCRLQPRLGHQAARASALTFLVSGTAVLDRACVAGTVDHDIVDALVAMFQDRLQALVADPPTDVPTERSNP